MRKALALWSFVVAAIAHAQPQTHPRDIYDDAPKATIAFWAHPEPYYVLDTQGDLRPEIQYVSDGSQPRAFICRDTRISFQLATLDTTPGVQDTIHRLDMSFAGEDFLSPDATAFVLKDHVKHIYMPQTMPDGIANIVGYEQILYHNIYAHTDLWLYSGATGQKMMLVFNPGSDPDDLRLHFQGQDNMQLDIFGNLKLLLEDKEIIIPQAVAYQLDQSDNIIPVSWTAGFIPNNNSGIVGLNFYNYDPTKRLILLFGPPPMPGGGPLQSDGFCWSTFLGGSYWDHFTASEQDADMNLYVAGSTASDFFSYGQGAGSNLIANPDDYASQAIVHKFNAQHELEWSTYLGGSQGLTQAHAISLKETTITPQIYVGGETGDEDLYLQQSNDAYYEDVVLGGLWHGWLAKLESNGEILWSTYFGDDRISIFGMDNYGHGELFITGIAASELPPEQVLPPPGALQQAYQGGGGDIFVARFGLTDQLEWATCYGTTGSEGGRALRCGDTSVVILGTAWNTGLVDAPGPSGAYHEPYQGETDLCIAEFTTGGELLWNTYLGGTGAEDSQSNCLDVDLTTNEIYVAGISKSEDLDYAQGIGWYDDTPQGNQSFVARFHGVDRSLTWLTNVDGKADGEVWEETAIRSVRVLPGGGLAVAGHAMEDPATGPIPYVIYPGVWSKPEAYENEGTTENRYKDAILLVFDDHQNLMHSTFVGGDGGPNGESIRSLSVRQWPEVVFCGNTSKNINLYTFFPLFDPGNDAWFDPVHNSQIWDDGWLASFCYAELPVTMPTPAMNGSGTAAWVDHDGILHYAGFPADRVAIDLYGPDGRSIWRGSTGGATGRMETGNRLSSGAYVLKAAGLPPLKFLITP